MAVWRAIPFLALLVPTMAGDLSGQGARLPTWPTPAGWTEETFPLPPSFADRVPLRGTELIRFMPGWARPDAADFWSYAFVWWLEEAPLFDSSTISAILTDYFRGLSAAVGGSKYQLDSTRFRTVLAPPSGAAERLTGQVFSYDAFKTGKPLTLNVDIERRRCPASRRIAIVLALSPKPAGDPVWTHLRAATAAFECP